MKAIQLVVFDLAGTTVDDGGAVLRRLVEAASDHGLEANPNELNGMMGMDKREVFGMLAARQNPEDGEAADHVAAAALGDFVEGMRSEYQRSLRPIDGAEQTFEFLRERGVKIAADTGFDATITGMIVDGLNWPGRLVDTVVCSSDVQRGRPAPYMIFEAMERLGIENVRRVMKVGDSPADMDEGFNAGCGEVVGVLSGAHTLETLGRCRHTRLMPSVADLPTLFQ